MNPPEPEESPQVQPQVREVRLRVLLETFDVYVRALAGIAAEGGMSEEVAVEALMNYCLALPEADDLIVGFLRGDLAISSRSDQTREMIERDTRFLELEPAGAPGRSTPTDRLGKKLEWLRRTEGTARVPAGKGAKLEKFIRENPATFKQVAASSHEFLVRWIMLHLMKEVEARERGRRVADEFWRQFPVLRARLNIESPLPLHGQAHSPVFQKTTVRGAGAPRIGSP